MPARNQINPRKLVYSKWTAVSPANKEKHFLVTSVLLDEDKVPQRCILEAVYSGRETELDWRELKDVRHWSVGWR